MDHDRDPPAATGALWAVRAGIGLAQGLALYGLQQAMDSKVWPAEDPRLFAPLALGFFFTPLILVAALGRFRRAALIAWPLAATAAIVVLGLFDVLRRGEAEALARGAEALLPSPRLFLCLGAGLFIAHNLVAAGTQGRRFPAPYPLYFDLAWKHGVQIALSTGFTLAFWAIVALGAGLFGLIGLKAVGEVVRQPWFNIPATCLMFACAAHLTDVRPALIAGVRSLALTLLAWLTPVAVAVFAAFLAALPFTGFKALWGAGSAVGLLLGAAAVLVVLVNAVWQDGERDAPSPLRLAARAAGLLLTPVVLLAAYGLYLRVAQYGWTPDRAVAAACVVVGVAYAAGYGRAAADRRGWLKGLGDDNVWTAVLALAVLAGLLTPLADPARLSARSQEARLVSGRVAPDAFDYAFLRFGAGRWGDRALARLAASGDPEIARRAAEARALEQRPATAPPQVDPAELAARIAVRPAGRVLPPGFLDQTAGEAYEPPLSCRQASSCDAVFVDLDGDGREEIVFADDRRLTLFAMEDGRWRNVGLFASQACDGVVEALRDGAFAVRDGRWRSLEIAGLSLQPNLAALECPPKPAVPTPPGRP